MTWFRAGCAGLFLLWFSGVLVLALCRAADDDHEGDQQL